MTIKSDRWIAQQADTREFTFTVNPDKLSDKTMDRPLQPVTWSESQLVQHSPLRPVLDQLLAMNTGETSEIEEGSLTVTCRARSAIIYPFTKESVNTMVYQGKERKIPSYGLSSYGYDIRLGRNFKRIEEVDAIVDILEPPYGLISNAFDLDYIDVPPHGFILGVSHEKITLPRNVTATCMAKSTLARLGLSAQVTPLEAGWSGYVTLEIFNMTPNLVRLYSGIGIMQLIFHESEQCQTSYSERGGKYMDQPSNPVEAKM